MLILSEIQSYWNATASLIAIAPLYLTSPKDVASYPYVVLSLVSTTTRYRTCGSYIEEAMVEFDIYHTNPATIKTYSTTIKSLFDWVKFSANTIACFRDNETAMEVEAKVYTGMLTYRIQSERN